MEKGLKIRYDRKVNEMVFWKYYFQAYNLNKPHAQKFTEFELDTIACIMSGDADKSPLKNKQRKELVDTLTSLGYRIQIQNVHTRIVKPLVAAGILFKSEDDMANGEYSLNKNLQTVQKYIKNKLSKGEEVSVSVYFNFTINGNA